MSLTKHRIVLKTKNAILASENNDELRTLDDIKKMHSYNKPIFFVNKDKGTVQIVESIQFNKEDALKHLAQNENLTVVDDSFSHLIHIIVDTTSPIGVIQTPEKAGIPAY